MSTEALVTSDLEQRPDRPAMSCKMGPNKAIGCAGGIGILAILIGLSLGVFWTTIYRSVLLNQLILTSSSMSFSLWKETPIPMYLEIHMFNWTNPEEFGKPGGAKPRFVEMGPYVFKEVDAKVNRVWNNENQTVTFQQRRTWHFEPSLSSGSLSDKVTNLNPVATSVTYMLRYQTKYLRYALNKYMNFIEEKLTVTRTVRELLFDGYPDKILTTASKLNISGIPYDKFGWFYTRNNSDTYDGTFNMKTGVDDVEELGMLKEWNYSNRSKFYAEDCGAIGGSLGDLWPPMKDKKTAKVFAPDVCTSMNLVHKEELEYLGVTGYKYVSDRDMLDNGTRVPSRACYCKNIECQPSGTFNVSQCKFGAPAFMSLPHFYLADESYRSAIDGMKPDEEKHEFSIVVEPTAGIPMQVRAKLQLNLMIQHDDYISMFKNAPKTFVPMLWFTQQANLSSSLASQIKFVLILPLLGHVTFYGIAGIGFLLLFIATGLYIRRHRRAEDSQTLIHSESNGAGRID